MFFWNACFSTSEFVRKSVKKNKEKEATWASPMCQKQWKSLYEIDILTFGVQMRVFNFLGKYKERWFSKSIWIGPCKGFSDFSELQRNVWSIFCQLVTCSQLLKFQYYRGRVTKVKGPPWIHRVPPWRPPGENKLPAGDVWQKQFYKKKPLKRLQVYHHRPLLL